MIAARTRFDALVVHTKGTIQVDVKEAVLNAKAFVADVFADEQIFNLGLEEVKFNDQGHIWEITIGFSRNWSRNALLPGSDERSYKIVRVREKNGEVISMTHRDLDTFD